MNSNIAELLCGLPISARAFATGVDKRGAVTLSFAEEPVAGIAPFNIHLGENYPLAHVSRGYSPEVKRARYGTSGNC